MDTRINHHQEICNSINWLLFSGPTRMALSTTPSVQKTANSMILLGVG
jgi:hypothetical protein